MKMIFRIAVLAVCWFPTFALAAEGETYGSCKTQKMVGFYYQTKPADAEIAFLESSEVRIRRDRALARSNVMLFVVDSESACISLKQKVFENLPSLLELPSSSNPSGDTALLTGELLVLLKKNADPGAVKSDLLSTKRSLVIVSEPSKYDNFFVVRMSSLAMNFEMEKRLLSKINGVDRASMLVGLIHY